jgi:hypothetical protein
MSASHLTQLQTVEIHQSNTVYYGIEYSPVAPTPGNVKVKYDQTVTTWTGTKIEQTLADGSSKVWRPRPTLAEAVSGAKGQYIQFFKDGSILLRDGRPTFWGRAEKGNPLVGIVVHSHVCLDGNEVFNDESDCFCETRIPLEEQRYSFWS